MRLILEGGDELAFGIAAIETLDFIVYKLKYCLFGIFPFLKGCGDVILIRLDLGVNIVTGHLDNKHFCFFLSFFLAFAPHGADFRFSWARLSRIRAPRRQCSWHRCS